MQWNVDSEYGGEDVHRIRSSHTGRPWAMGHIGKLIPECAELMLELRRGFHNLELPNLRQNITPYSPLLELVAVPESGGYQPPCKMYEVAESYVVFILPRVLAVPGVQIALNDVDPSVVVGWCTTDSDCHYALCIVLDPRIRAILAQSSEGKANKGNASKNVRI